MSLQWSPITDWRPRLRWVRSLAPTSHLAAAEYVLGQAGTPGTRSGAKYRRRPYSMLLTRSSRPALRTLATTMVRPCCIPAVYSRYVHRACLIEPISPGFLQFSLTTAGMHPSGSLMAAPRLIRPSSRTAFDGLQTKSTLSVSRPVFTARLEPTHVVSSLALLTTRRLMPSSTPTGVSRVKNIAFGVRPSLFTDSSYAYRLRLCQVRCLLLC